MSSIKIDVNASVTRRLPFEPSEEYDGLCLGYLTGVTFNKTESKDKAKWEFAGMEIPTLAFEFTQQKDAANTKDRFIIHSILPVTLTDSKGANREESKIAESYTGMWKWIKHVMDAYLGKQGVKPIDFSVEFNPDQDINKRLAEFETFFSNVAKWFNEALNGKPVYLPYGGTENNNLCVIKLVADSTSKYLEFPMYVNRGFIEPAVFTNGKLDTALKFYGNETSVLGAVAVQTSNGTNPVASNISQNLQDILKKAQQG